MPYDHAVRRWRRAWAGRFTVAGVGGGRREVGVHLALREQQQGRVYRVDRGHGTRVEGDGFARLQALVERGLGGGPKNLRRTRPAIPRGTIAAETTSRSRSRAFLVRVFQ